MRKVFVRTAANFLTVGLAMGVAMPIAGPAAAGVAAVITMAGVTVLDEIRAAQRKN